MIEWRHFLRRVVMHLPGCPEPFVVDALRDAATDFCTRTRIWKVKHVMLATTVAGQTNYAIASGAAEGEVTHLHAAWVGETEVPINTPGEDDDTAPGKSEASFKLRLVDGTSVQLTPAPSVAGQVIKGTVSYRPFSDATGAPDEVGDRRWSEAIEKLAMAELMMQPGKPWSSPMARPFIERYDYLCEEAAHSVGVVRRSPIRVRPAP